MAQLKDLIVNGPGRILSDLYVQNKIYENGEALEDKYDEIVYVDTTATFSDVYNLKQNGKLPVYKDATGFAFPELVEDSSPGSFIFTKMNDSGVLYWYKVDTSDAWTSGTKDTIDLYWCGYGSTTYTAVSNAISAGKLPVLLYNNYLSVYSLTQSNVHYFLAWVSSSGSIVRYSLSSSNSWATSNITLQPKYLVTSWQTTPDDTHYPSEKLVKNSLASKVSEPSSEGTNGQVLTTDGSGGRTWTTVGAGSSNVVLVDQSTSYSSALSAYNDGKTLIYLDSSGNGATLAAYEPDGHGITVFSQGFYALTLQAAVIPTTDVTVDITYTGGSTQTVTIEWYDWDTDGTVVISPSVDPYEYPVTSVVEQTSGYRFVFTRTTSMILTTYTLTSGNSWSTESTNLQEKLVSSTNIKTIDNTSVLGTGNISTKEAYNLTVNGSALRMKSVTYRYRLLFTSADGQYFVPANNSTSTNTSDSRSPCQDAIDPFGAIYYYKNTSSVSANSTPWYGYLYYQYRIDFGYSFKGSSSLNLTRERPVYLKCSPQSNGSAKIYNNTVPWTQALPSTADGYIYIFLGIATGTTQMELLPYHPVYYYDGTKIALWTGGTSGGGGTSALSTSVTLTSSGWSSNTQSVTPSSGGSSIDPSEYDTIIVSPSGDPSNYANAGIYCSSTYYYGMEFTCKNVPTSDIVVNVLLM